MLVPCCVAVVGTVVLTACSTDDEPILLSQGPAAETVDSDDTDSAPMEMTTADSRAGYTVVAESVVGRMSARAGPDPDAEVIAEFQHPTPVGGPLVFRAVDGALDDPAGGGGEWLEVLLPIQPNGTTGWIRADEVSLSNNPYRLEIDRAGFTLRVYELSELWLQTTIAVGTGDTPTPVGEFYLKELLAPPDPNGPYGPYAFGLSGFSEVLESFGGADTAIIGLHGTNDPDALGTNVSSGCIRLENAVIEQLAQTLPLGTPVVIT
jgi:hypothetical protein